MSKNCLNCGEMVTERFARVYGDNNDDIHHCINCLKLKEGGRSILRRGAGATSDLDEVNFHIKT